MGRTGDDVGARIHLAHWPLVRLGRTVRGKGIVVAKGATARAATAAWPKTVLTARRQAQQAVAAVARLDTDVDGAEPVQSKRTMARSPRPAMASKRLVRVVGASGPWRSPV